MGTELVLLSHDTYFAIKDWEARMDSEGKGPSWITIDVQEEGQWNTESYYENLYSGTSLFTFDLGLTGFNACWL